MQFHKRVGGVDITSIPIGSLYQNQIEERLH